MSPAAMSSQKPCPVSPYRHAAGEMDMTMIIRNTNDVHTGPDQRHRRGPVKEVDLFT